MKVNFGLIGKRIKEHRQRRNLTQEMLAELIEMSPGYMSLIETGKKKASVETLLMICRALNITLSDLLTGNQIVLNSDYNREIAELMSGCNEYERRLIFEIIRTVRDVLMQNSENWIFE